MARFGGRLRSLIYVDFRVGQIEVFFGRYEARIRGSDRPRPATGGRRQRQIQVGQHGRPGISTLHRSGGRGYARAEGGGRTTAGRGTITGRR